METTRFLDLPCLELTRGDLSALVPTSVGPRVLALFVDGENVFAELPGRGLDHPSGAKYTFHGGHRLWYAPEYPAVTYLPDDGPVECEAVPGGVRITAEPEPGTGMEKSMTVGFSTEGSIRVEHGLTNRGERSVVCAPWAITQLKTGGTAILPLPERIPGYTPFQPNRSLVFWPYTDPADPRLGLGKRFAFVSAGRGEGALKIGAPNPNGWLAYHRDRLLFVKRAAWDPQADYLDLGASSQLYCNAEVLELETLGPRVTLQPGETTSHVETWRIFRDVEFDGTEARAADLAAMWDLEGWSAGG